MKKKKNRILDAERIERILTRISHEILERNKEPANIVLVAIRRGGELVGKRITEKLRTVLSEPFPLGFLDITLYRDDLNTSEDYPVVRKTEIPFPIEGRNVILVDDVLFTGRTIRAAMEALQNFGRPERIQLAVLVDRGHRELPIHPDYIGRNIPTDKEDLVVVQLTPDLSDDYVEVQATNWAGPEDE